jgi:hypothetical protein
MMGVSHHEPVPAPMLASAPMTEQPREIPLRELGFLITHLESNLPPEPTSWWDRLTAVRTAATAFAVSAAMTVVTIGVGMAAASVSGSVSGVGTDVLGVIAAILGVCAFGAGCVGMHQVESLLAQRREERTRRLAERIVTILASPVVYRHASPTDRSRMVLESRVPGVPPGPETREVFGRIVEITATPGIPAKGDRIEIPTGVAATAWDFLRSIAASESPYRQVATELVHRLSATDEV